MRTLQTGVILFLALTVDVVGTMSAQSMQKNMLNDGQVMALFDEANTADIWTARLAIGKAQSAEVRSLAEMVIADHEAVQQMGRELARTLKMAAAPPTGDMSASALATAIQQLQSKSGADFDRAYLSHELAFHRSAIDAVRGTLLPAAKNAELKTLLSDVLGGFEHHLSATRAVADTMGVK
jgi:putative membrane protein